MLDEENQVLDPAANVGVVGRLGRGGSVPLGYYKDPEKSATTFLEIGGARYSVPGDFARHRGRQPHHAAGPRLATASTPAARRSTPRRWRWRSRRTPASSTRSWSATPDERFGQRVTAVVQPREDEETPTLADLDAHLRSQLSGYKIPRSLVTVEQIPRHVTGKANYPKARDLALAGVSTAAAGA